MSNQSILPDTDDIASNDLSRLILGSIYAVLSCSFFGNLTVICFVMQILLSTNQGASPNGGSMCNQNTHILIYILALSIVDSFVLINAAIVSTTIFFQTWIYPGIMCTASYAIDSVNKTLSTFILTCMSLDRFLAVRYPQKRFKIRSVNGTIFVLVFCLFFAFLLLLPVYWQTDIIQVRILNSNRTTSTCAFVGEADFAMLVAVLGYFVPFILMSIFYCNMLNSLKRRKKKFCTNSSSRVHNEESSPTPNHRPSIRVKQVTVRTLFLVLFHFGCWTPYWMFTFYMLKSEWEIHDLMVVVMYVVHIGTYLNSAVNPVLYALLNRDLRRRRRNTLKRKRRIVQNLNVE